MPFTYFRIPSYHRARYYLGINYLIAGSKDSAIDEYRILPVPRRKGLGPNLAVGGRSKPSGQNRLSSSGFADGSIPSRFGKVTPPERPLGGRVSHGDPQCGGAGGAGNGADVDRGPHAGGPDPGVPDARPGDPCSQCQGRSDTVSRTGGRREKR